MTNTNLMDWNWPVDVGYSQQPIGELAVKGLMGVIHKFVLLPTYGVDDNGVLRVVGWSFVIRDQVLKPDLLARIEEQERQHLDLWKKLNQEKKQ